MFGIMEFWKKMTLRYRFKAWRVCTLERWRFGFAESVGSYRVLGELILAC